MPSSYTCLRFHLIWSTKHRQPILGDEVCQRMFQYIGGILRNDGGKLLVAGGMPNHVHLLADIGKTQSVADSVRDIKSNSSGWIHQTFPELKSFAWQAGYAAFTVSYSSTDSVKSYIAHQAEHHRQRTFQEEFVEFLRRHGIDYDERYLWE
ncbi:MAG: IS200/IS605 family transposase [Pirellulaceae bacterium]|nr:IS200/IS605 family transposase [Pirellulaceae bacterium]